MFRSSPIEEFEERLSRIRAALEEKERLKTRLREAEAQRQQLEAKIEAAMKRVAREERDVERFEAGGLITQIYEALNLADSKLEKERREYLAAAWRLQEAEKELALLDQETIAIAARLDELGDADEAYRKALAEKQKWLDTAGHPGVTPGLAEALERAERAGLLREWLREIDEAIDFGQRADAALDRLAETLAEIERWWAAGQTPSVVARAVAEDMTWHTSLAQHRIKLFYAEVLEVHNRVKELTRTLQPMDLPQLLGLFDDFPVNWSEKTGQRETSDAITGLHAKLRTLLGWLQAVRNAAVVQAAVLRVELASPRAAADVLRDLDRIHGE